MLLTTETWDEVMHLMRFFSYSEDDQVHDLQKWALRASPWDCFKRYMLRRCRGEG